MQAFFQQENEVLEVSPHRHDLCVAQSTPYVYGAATTATATAAAAAAVCREESGGSRQTTKGALLSAFHPCMQQQQQPYAAALSSAKKNSKELSGWLCKQLSPRLLCFKQMSFKRQNILQEILRTSCTMEMRKKGTRETTSPPDRSCGRSVDYFAKAVSATK
ncbi:unnamed protein product [Litomosoides sigmodontis]|uniref:Uncharacterized protein n=1 Tax=Litomosoides sigmodontis TaxID=42156 RepID=A0A3P6U762_LITSI|nr:unnamed protein product [Litomosoides sigmodontis]